MLPAGVTVTRLRGTLVPDGYGGERVDWADPDTLEVHGCGLAPRTDDELRDRGRQGVVVGWTLYAPYGADIGFRDRIRYAGRTYEVEGEPNSWRNPFTGREAGMTAALRVVEG